MPELISCPAADEYRCLARGEPTSREAELLLAHLESCDDCAKRVGALPEPDTLVDLMRHTGTEAGWTTSAPVARLIAQLSQLRPNALVALEAEQSERMLTQSRPKVGAAQPVELYDWLAPSEIDGELGRLGPYHVLQILGVGGMGVVFLARDPQLDRVVALKAMLPTLAGSARARQRFLREARAAAAIKHDHIVAIYQVGEDQGVPFLAMEFLEGEPLDACLERKGKLAVAELLRIGREIALGLAAAHKRDLIHRDIKPSNVWLEAESERVKILDFGLARAATEETHLTQEGAIVGTPEYMSPEQAQGQRVDHRSDLFSLGCVLYRMTTGTAPFQSADFVSTLLAVSTHTPPSPSEVDAGLPATLSELIMGLLAKNPEERPATAEEVALALAHMEHAPTRARTIPSARRWKWVATTFTLLLTSVLLLAVATTFHLITKDGIIVLEDLPAGAEVVVDGAKAKVRYGPNGKSIEVQVAPGERKLLIKADGFVAKTQDIFLEAGERKPLHIRLEPLPGEPRPAAKVSTAAGGYTQLFDGKNLIGMMTEGNPSAEWKIENGVLIGRWPPFHDSPGGSHLFTKRDDYQNFRFRVETTLCENWACSMVFGWVNDVRPKTWYRVAIGPSSGRDVLTTGMLRRSLSGPILARVDPPVKLRDGEWFTEEVVVTGKRIQIYINDVLRTSYVADEPPQRGHVGIALSGQSSIRLRKMEVKELPATASEAR